MPPVLRVLAVSFGKTYEGGKQIKYFLDNKELALEGQKAREVLDEANNSEGLWGDLPSILAGFIGLIKQEGQEHIDAEWMTQEELKTVIAQKKNDATGFQKFLSRLS